MKNFDMVETNHGFVVVADGPLTTAARSDAEIDFQFDRLVDELNGLRAKMKSAKRSPMVFGTTGNADRT